MHKPNSLFVFAAAFASAFTCQAMQYDPSDPYGSSDPSVRRIMENGDIPTAERLLNLSGGDLQVQAAREWIENGRPFSAIPLRVVEAMMESGDVRAAEYLLSFPSGIDEGLRARAQQIRTNSLSVSAAAPSSASPCQAMPYDPYAPYAPYDPYDPLLYGPSGTCMSPPSRRTIIRPCPTVSMEIVASTEPV